MSLSINPVALSVYRYWFGEEELTPANIERRQPLWWAGGADQDYDIERRFGKLVEAASQGAFREWLDTPASNLALIILTDQFPRNLWRGTARAFSCDSLAREYATALVQQEVFAQMNPAERTFALMPFEHSESLQDQDFCLQEFEKLEREAGPEWQSTVAGFVKFARSHRDIIQQFGRFPHRNRARGRENTAEEEEWLAEGGQGFGQ